MRGGPKLRRSVEEMVGGCVAPATLSEQEVARGRGGAIREQDLELGPGVPVRAALHLSPPIPCPTGRGALQGRPSRE